MIQIANSASIKPAADHRTGETRSDGWTPEQQYRFLFALSTTGIVRHASKFVGKSDISAYVFRHSPRGRAFKLGWHAANLLARDLIEDRLITAAIEGVVALTRRSLATATRSALQSRLSMGMLARLDARAAAMGDHEAAVARSICTAFEEFLEQVIRKGPSEAGISAFLASHPDPLAVQVAAHRHAQAAPDAAPEATKNAETPQLVEDSAISVPGPGPVVATLATRTPEPCTCPGDQASVMLELA